MSEELCVQNVFDGFFVGGARVAQTSATIGLHGQQHHGVTTINGEMFREGTLQPMTNDRCYQRLVQAGIAVTSLGLRGNAHIDYDQIFSPQTLETFQESIAKAHVVTSLKEQPLRLLRQAEMGRTPVVACLHRSDPENQEGGVEELLAAIKRGSVALCTISGVSARQAYIDQGVPADKIRTIPNGVDLDLYKSSREARTRTREMLGIEESSPVVLFVGRCDGPMKNIPLFLSSARLWLSADPSAHVVMCGTGITPDNPHFLQEARQWFADAPHAVLNRLHCLGPRRDMHTIYPAADVLSLTSRFGETEPLVMLEAMASASKEFGPVPVATDVGDTRLMLAEGRGLITPHSAPDIVSAWQEVLANRGDFLNVLVEAATRDRIDERRTIAAYGQAFEDAATMR